MAALDLDRYELGRLLDLLREQRDGVTSGDTSGYGQSYQDELDDIDDLTKKLESAR